MANDFTRTQDLGFEMDSWETTLGIYGTTETARPGDLRRCEHPDCRRPFTVTKPWARYCCRQCQQADVAEHRRIGHLLAAPMLAARVGKHADRKSVAGRKSTLARTWCDQLLSHWKEARALRAAVAEERHPEPHRNAA